MHNSGFVTTFQVPREREDHVSRPRLVASLAAHASAPVQVVLAPAAYGKTTLLSEFARQSQRRICWFTVEASNLDVEGFVRGVYSSVQVQFPSLPPLPGFSTPSPNEAHIKSLVVRLVNAIESLGDEKLTLIWDDFHVVANQEQIQSVVGLVVDHLPANCSIIIATRTAPKFKSLDRLLAYRDAFMLTARDLTFQTSEIRSLLAVLRDRAVTTKEAKVIRDLTDGWVGGVLSSETGGLAKGDSLQDSKQTLQTFAMTAIAAETDEERRFLLMTSVLPYVDPEVCDEVLEIDCSAGLLARAYERIGFLVQTQGSPRRYRWHDLIREGLEGQFRADHQRDYLRTTVRAAEILEGRGEIEYALALFAKAGEYGEVGRLMVQEGEGILRDGRWGILDRWLKQLPAAFVEQDPGLLELRGRLAARLQEGESAVGYFNQALACVAEDADPALRPRILVSRSSAYQLLGMHGEAESDAKLAIDLFEALDDSQHDLSRAVRQLGNNYLFQARFREAERCLLRALRMVRASADVYEISYLSGLLGWACGELGKSSESHHYLEEAVQGWRKLRNLGELSVSLNNLAQLWYIQGQLDVARDFLEEALEHAEQIGYTRFEAVILVGIGDIARDTNDLHEALEYYGRGLKLARQTSEANLVSYAICVTGETYRLKGEYEKAEVLLREAETLAGAQGQRYERALALMFSALLTARTGDYAAANDRLAGAERLLSKSGQVHGLALLDLYRAQIAFLSRDLLTCESSLARLAGRCHDLGYSGFLAAEVSRAPGMFEWAADKGISGTFYLRIWDEALARGDGSLSTLAPGRLSLDIKVYGLGKSRVLVGAEPVAQDEWQSPKAKEILYYLLTRQSPARKETICADLWPDASALTASNNFHSSLRRLRNAIHPAVVVLRDGAYQVNPHIDVWFDLWAFLDSINGAVALPKGSAKRASLLEGAIGLHDGPLLEEFYSEWAETLRRETQTSYLKTVTGLAGFHAGRKDFARAIGLLERAKNSDQLEEDVPLHMMRYLLASGDAPSAIHVYDEYSTTVQSELATTPSPAMRRVYEEAISAL